jgi:hypothetical protein
MSEKGIGGGRLERQTQLEEEDIIIYKWAQEEVNRLYSLLTHNIKCCGVCSGLGGDRNVCKMSFVCHQYGRPLGRLEHI